MVSMPHWPSTNWGKQDFKSIFRVLGELDSPHKKLPPVIHVAGTNGKGSTLSYLRSIFQSSGYKVHRYTSPHLVEFNERILIDGENISDEYLWYICEKTRIATEKCDAKLSFFEGVTIASMIAFSETQADILLLETGMGGRLDATNIIENPILTIITEISYDHMEHLGWNLQSIAVEKAGIMKASAPCVISAQMDEVYEVLFNHAERVGTNAISFGYDFGIRMHDNTFNILGQCCDDFHFKFPSLEGRHQIMNAATAISGIFQIRDMFKISLDDINQGITNAAWSGRMQRVKLTDDFEVILDGAHNIAGAIALNDFISQNFPDQKCSIILGITKNRSVVDFLNPLRTIAGKIFCVAVKSESSSYESEKLAELASSDGFHAASSDSLSEAILLARDLGNPVIITGSLFLIGDVLKNLGHLRSICRG